jgi:hypothetical protein
LVAWWWAELEGWVVGGGGGVRTRDKSESELEGRERVAVDDGCYMLPEGD